MAHHRDLQRQNKVQLAAFQRKYGSRNHVEVGHTCAFVASALWVGAGDVEEAHELQSRAVSIYLACLGTDHRVTKDALHDLSVLGSRRR